MKPTIKYFLLTCKHKYFVFVAGLKTKAPVWRLLIHDWTKFLPDELPHYGRQFFGKADDSKGFILCWLKHQNRNPHHWEYYIPRTGHNRCDPPYKNNEPIPMPMWAVREMIADWMGAGKAYNGCWPDIENWEWFNNKFPEMVLHHLTKERIYAVIREMIKRKQEF